MESMTQNSLADLRSMEHAAEDKKDRYLLGLCTLFVATIEDAKDRISQVELVFCNQLFPAFQAMLLESRQAVQDAENLHQKALQDWESCREDLIREIQELRTDRVSHEDLHRSPHREDELASHREGLFGNEPLQGSLQSKFEKLSDEAAELRQINIKIQQENQYIHQHCSKISSELGVLKSKMLSVSLETSPTVAETEALDMKSLHAKLEQKGQERSLECFRRQLISAEVEKEKKATHAALVKLHTLKKKYQSLRKQYTVLFRHSHLLERQKLADHNDKQVQSDLGDAAVERYLTTTVGELEAKCNCRKARTYIATPPSSKAKDSSTSAPSLAHEDVSRKLAHVSIVCADDHERQVSKQAELTNTVKPRKEVDFAVTMDSLKSPHFFQGPDGAEKRSFVEDDQAEKDDRVLDTPQSLSPVENNISKKMSLQPNESILPAKSRDQEIDCNSAIHIDKASQVGFYSSSFLKVTNLADGDEMDEKTEACNYGDNIQDSSRSPEALLPAEDVQDKIKEGPGVNRLADSGWCPIQKRGSSSKCHPKAFKSLKTTWRNTRSRAEMNGFDPHDDFLDTPHENVLRSHANQAMTNNHGMIAQHGNGAVLNSSESKGILERRCKQEWLVDCGGKDVSFSQITTQAPDPEADFTFSGNQNEKHANERTGFQHLGSNDNTSEPPRKQGQRVEHLGGDNKNKHSSSATGKAKVLPVLKQGPMYKYVEPVRKKDEREKLQGVECNQCKKFYDAVLHNNCSDAVSLRCEHHDAVSRHRYRYMPPSTPEGFWNIGFDSEM